MYTQKNFKTKKELKTAVEAYNASLVTGPQTCQSSLGDILAIGKPCPVTYFQPGPFGVNETQNGTFCCEGPHYPQPHKWYATCTAVNGIIVKVK